METNEKFKMVIPAVLEKGKDEGEWRIYGLASTPDRDSQNEVIDLKGLDLSPIKKGRGVFNIDHKKGFEHTVGAIDKYKLTDEGLYLGGYLFQNHDKAKAVYQIMSSLKKSDRGRMGLSVEGVIKKRDEKDNKKITKAVITSCALTMNPINENTYADLCKSFGGSVEFETEDLQEEISNSPTKSETSVTFTTEQVVALMEKSMGVGHAYATSTPGELSGGDALAQESLDSKKKKKKKEPTDVAAPDMKKSSSEMFKSWMADMLVELQKLYPEASRSEIWETVKDRVNTRFGTNKKPEK